MPSLRQKPTNSCQTTPFQVLTIPSKLLLYIRTQERKWCILTVENKVGNRAQPASIVEKIVLWIGIGISGAAAFFGGVVIAGAFMLDATPHSDFGGTEIVAWVIQPILWTIVYAVFCMLYAIIVLITFRIPLYAEWKGYRDERKARKNRSHILNSTA